MAGYIIADVTVLDPQKYEEYRRQVPASLAPFGGRFLVRGGRTETLEGDWSPKRFVILEFPSIEAARSWWSSPEYGPARALRQRIARTELIAAEGV